MRRKLPVLNGTDHDRKPAPMPPTLTLLSHLFPLRAGRCKRSPGLLRPLLR